MNTTLRRHPVISLLNKGVSLICGAITAVVRIQSFGVSMCRAPMCVIGVAAPFADMVVDCFWSFFGTCHGVER